MLYILKVITLQNILHDFLNEDQYQLIS